VAGVISSGMPMAEIMVYSCICTLATLFHRLPIARVLGTCSAWRNTQG